MGLGAAHRGSVKQAGESLAAARDAAHAARELVKRGGDPIDERDGRRQAAHAGRSKMRRPRSGSEQLTLARAARDYHERVIEPTRTAKHGANWIASLEHHIPVARLARPDSVDYGAAAPGRDAHGAIRRKQASRRSRRRCSACASASTPCSRMRSSTATASTNPAAAIRRKMREAMPRGEGGQLKALPYREAPAFMERLRERSRASLRAASSATAQRRGHRCALPRVLGADRVPDVGIAAGDLVKNSTSMPSLWVIPKERMKAKEEHVVHLSPRAVEILRGQLLLDPVYPFPSPMLEGRPMSNMAMLTVLDRLGRCASARPCTASAGRRSRPGRTRLEQSLAPMS